MKDLKKNLLRETSKERINEMDKYGRSDAYKKIHESLKGNRLKGFMLANFGLAIIDDFVDNKNSKFEFKILADVLRASYKNKDVKQKNKLSANITELGKVLRKLKKERYIYAGEIYKETLDILKFDQKNIDRHGKILSQKELDKLNYSYGGSIGRQLMYFMFSEIPKKKIQKVADKCGYVVRIADCLSDIEEDLEKGLINISKENIKRYGLRVSKGKGDSYVIGPKKELKKYSKSELIRAEKSFLDTFNDLDRLINDYPNEKNKLVAWKNFIHSWLKQAKEIVK